uniref:Uncharacterized protein n=1 Tax=Wuchereria bancrofti TaxID=6293 RepID=A0AAF5Q733_WUCBA
MCILVVVFKNNRLILKYLMNFRIRQIGSVKTKPVKSDSAYYPLKLTPEQKKNAIMLMDFLEKRISHYAEDLRQDLAKHPPAVEDLNKKLEYQVNLNTIVVEGTMVKWLKDGFCEY